MGSINKYIAELIGTFVLVFIGCGSAVLAGGNVGYLGIAFAFGVAVLVMVYTIGSISGCHINPAVTTGLWINKKIGTKDGIMYIIFQSIGAILGSVVLYIIALGKSGYSLTDNGLGQNGFGSSSPEGYSLVSGFVAEVVLTFIFLIIILGATHEKAPKGFAGIAIGLGLFIIHIVGIPVTGTSVNPARSLGPAVVLAIEDTTALLQVWLFWVAPLAGALIAGIFWKLYSKSLSEE